MKRYLKLLALLIAVALIIGLGWFANSLVGNPVSKYLATRSAQTLLTERFADTDYTMERITYSFKDGCYHAFYTSLADIDGDFSATFTQTGKYRYDTYDSVLNGSNTARRLEMEYRALTDTVIESPTFPYPSDIGYGTLEIYPLEFINDKNIPDIPAYAIPQEELERNKLYDIPALGARAGHLILYVDSKIVTYEEAARILLDIRQRMDEAGVPFRAVDFVLWYPRPEEGQRPDGEIRILDFAYGDIYEDGMTDRVRQAAAATDAYYAALDAQK